jgi:hypothetical protein
LFWDVEFESLDSSRDADFVLPRVLEFGRLRDIRWLIDTYGVDRIHYFLREQGHPELSARTTAFWRSYFNASGESWASIPAWRRNSNAHWLG